MRLRDHDKADLALAALTASVAAAGAVVEVSRWVRRDRGRPVRRSRGVGTVQGPSQG